jgi:hypothetical protein
MGSFFDYVWLCDVSAFEARSFLWNLITGSVYIRERWIVNPGGGLFYGFLKVEKMG